MQIKTMKTQSQHCCVVGEVIMESSGRCPVIVRCDQREVFTLDMISLEESEETVKKLLTSLSLFVSLNSQAIQNWHGTMSKQMII